MNKIEKLMSKWWFRLALIAAFSFVLFLVGMLLIPGDRETTKYANDGVLTIMSVIFVSIANVLMYFATDVLDDIHVKIGKILRKAILLISLGLFILSMLIGLGTYIINVKNEYVMQPVFDGLGLAPFMTYAFLYFFVVGKFEVIDDREPNRKKQFILTLIACIAPIVIGILLILILNIINNVTVSFIVLIISVLIFAFAFISSIRKYGLFLGGAKEFDREKPVSTSTYNSTAGEWENKFVSEIEKHSYGTYTSVSAYASMYEGCIIVDVTINYYGGSTYTEEKWIIKAQNDAAAQVKDYYKKVAGECPHSSKLNIKFK